jgi:hypothetical protein
MMSRLSLASRILALFGLKHRKDAIPQPRTVLDARHDALRRIARDKLEQGLLPWGAPTLERQNQINHTDIVSRECGLEQVKVIGMMPNGFDRIIVRRHNVIVDVMPYLPSSGEVFGGMS